MGKSRPPKVHRYSMHFKATAVRLRELPDVLIHAVAEALDIHPFMLSRWRKQAREGLINTSGVRVNQCLTPRSQIILAMPTVGLMSLGVKRPQCSVWLLFHDSQ